MSCSSTSNESKTGVFFCNSASCVFQLQSTQLLPFSRVSFAGSYAVVSGQKRVYELITCHFAATAAIFVCAFLTMRDRNSVPVDQKMRVWFNPAATEDCARIASCY